MAEYDFPTVRKGSYILLGLTSMVTARILWHGAEAYTVEALKGLLAAVAGTHAMLVLGGGFNNSTLARPPANMIQETTTTTKTAPVAPVKDLNVTAENVNVAS